ncbi:hypothetical protein Hypma_005050 [Hypsizygus marmoreus]|uniref:Cytochrome P450 67 n=1 Tax=Hypsizygus marmoreus TaxID=39966 RepID=A0A369K354_HYPMA|nr:hypothetical protein Hypma_005050 [Hypsizygus marmoreus]
MFKMAMELNNQSKALLQVVLLAAVTHQYFRRFEPKSLISLASILILEPAAFLAVSGLVILNAASIFAVYVTFLLSLGLFIVLHRISPLHPLAKFPGPTINKVTQLWSVWVQRNGHQHLVNKRLHDKYGPFVRIGPNELSIIDLDAALAILGPGGLSKGRYYEARQDPRAPGNLLALRGQAHTDRRRLWSRAFTNEALTEYEQPLSKRAQALVDRLGMLPQPIDLSFWISLFALDFMGDMAFGGGFEMLRAGGDPDGMQVMFDKFTVSLSMLCQVPWAAPTMQRLPFLSKNILKLRQFAVDWGTSRAKRGSTTKDLWYHLSDEAGLEKERPQIRNVIADGALAMIAGSDTTATGLCNLFYFLLSHPECYKRLKAEIDNVYPQGENALDTSKHSSMPYLTACINETLRLLPPALTNGPRQVPLGSGGRIFGGRYIPEGTQVYIPPYSVHRNPLHFSPATEEFVPERWLSGRNDEDQVFNLSAFIPFSFGPANCVGRNLARREMMMVSSLILQKFDLRFADGYDSSLWVDQLHDHFVTRRGPLPVALTPRF